MSPPESVPQAKFTENEGRLSSDVIKLLRQKTVTNSTKGMRTLDSC